MQVSHFLFSFLLAFIGKGLEIYSNIRNEGIELRDRAKCFQLQRYEGVLIVKEIFLKAFSICWAIRAFRTVFFKGM